MLRSFAALVLSILLAVSASADVGNSMGQHPVPDEVRFVILGDSQFSKKGQFERMIHEVNLLRPNYVTQVGDLIHGYTYDDVQLRKEWGLYKAQIEPLTMPFYPVPGNHDVVTPEAEAVYGEVWGKDHYVYSYDYGPVHNIVLDTYYQEEDDRIKEWQQDWLKNDLENYAKEAGDDLRNRSIFVYMHAPLWRYAKDHPGRKDWDKIHDMLKQYPVRMVVGGHTHEYVWENRDGIDYVVINSSGSMSQDNERGGFFHCFLHVSVHNGNDVRVAVLLPDSVLPLDTVNNEERSSIPKYSLRSGTMRVADWMEGEPLDTTISISIENKLNTPRIYRVDWHLPMNSNVKVEPEGEWIQVPPGATATPKFRITSSSAPAEELRPWLELSTEQDLRSGVVSREWEKRYKERQAAADAGENVIVTNIPLTEKIRYTARYQIFVPPVAEASQKKGDIVIDGKLDDMAWKKATPVTAFTDSDGKAPDVATSVQFLYDDDYLYVGARMEEPRPDLMTNKAEGDIALTWSDDDLELFFDPDQTENLYHRLFQNSFGTRFNSMPRNVDDKYFKSTYASKIEVGEDFWTLEMQIPWKEMGADKAPGSGDKWNINIGRHRHQSEPAEFQWSSMNGQGLYDPTRYGVLAFE